MQSMEKIALRERRKQVLAPGSISSVAEISTLSPAIIYEPSRFYIISKRLIDILLSLIGIIGLLPVFLMIAICIKLDDGGDILYRREMVGLRGQPFIMFKFRTMIPNADTYLEKQAELKQEFERSMKLKHDPRITRVGRFLRKTYLDELPQLFNVLMGQMSLVGPRAIHQRELVLYGEYAEKRHVVKPGLTGLWQISPDRHRSYEQRIPLDMHYIDTRSLIVDLMILLKTLKVLFAHTGM
jgi:lipopolysaccharide/colanic/teichoic acid biosynthesis glycosyltransferase